MKRVKIVPKKCPNPLFEKWLLEWRDEARAKSSNMETHFTKAVLSLQKYPLPLESGRDCILLQHFGVKLCAMLDRKLRDHLDRKISAVGESCEISRDRETDPEHDALPQKSRRLQKSPTHEKQVPRKQFREKQKRNGKECVKKKFEIADCLAVPADEFRSEIRASEKTKKISPRRSRDHSISSSESGSCNDLPIVEILDDVDDKIFDAVGTVGDNVPEKPSEFARTVETTKSTKDGNYSDGGDDEFAKIVETLDKDQFEMVPYSFDVILLVDTHETAGGKTKPKNDATISELNKLKVRYEIRHLKIGDFAWIARCRDTQRELVLPYVVERKRMDDLGSSIKDGRFHEQKFRLKQSGIPNIIYMVESHGKNQHVGMPLPTLLQATTNTLVQDHFTVKFTENHFHSMRYLSNLTTLVEKTFTGNHLVSGTKENLERVFASKDKIMLMEFQQFNKAASKVKTFKVTEMFVRQLLQLKGLSVEKALAIVEVYPTPKILTKAFEIAGDGAEKLLAPIQINSQQRQLGPALSKTIFELYTKRILE